MGGPALSRALPKPSLAAPARTPAAHALIATPIPHHDRAADMAAGRISHVDHAGQRVGYVTRALPLVVGRWPEVRRAIQFSYAFRVHAIQPRTQVLEQQLLLSGEEAQLEPAEDVVHDRLGKADLGILAPAAGLEAGVRELFAQQLERHAVLQRHRDRQRKTVHQAADRRTFFRHLDEQFARLAVGIEADSDVALVSADVELVRD